MIAAWGKAVVKETQAWTEYCDVNNKPYILVPAWGPFENSEIADPTRIICEKASLFISRDDESSRYWLNYKMCLLLQSGRRQIAFRFSGDSTVVGRTLIRGLGLGKDRPIIGMVPNMRVYERLPGVGLNNHYVKLLVALIDHCTAKLGAKVLLMPNEIKVPGASGPDDRFLSALWLRK